MIYSTKTIKSFKIETFHHIVVSIQRMRLTSMRIFYDYFTINRRIVCFIGWDSEVLVIIIMLQGLEMKIMKWTRVKRLGFFQLS